MLDKKLVLFVTLFALPLAKDAKKFLTVAKIVLRKTTKDTKNYAKNLFLASL